MHAWTDVTPTTAVVETIADALDVGVTDLEPLRNVVDPDALDKLAQPGTRGGGRDLRVSFSYHDYFVVVRQTGRVTLYDLDD